MFNANCAVNNHY